jgi:hypothetical protein
MRREECLKAQVRRRYSGIPPVIWIPAHLTSSSYVQGFGGLVILYYVIYTKKDIRSSN